MPASTETYNDSNNNSSSSNKNKKNGYHEVSVGRRSFLAPDAPARLSAGAQRTAEEDLNETPARRKHCLRELRGWVRQQRHLAHCRTDAPFLLRFLRFQKFDLGDAAAVVDKYVQMRTAHPEWFSGLDVRDPRMRDLVTSGYLFVLPGRDAAGRRVVFSRAADMDPSRFTAADLMRAHILAYETLLCDEENQVKGLTYVFDERDLNWSHVSIWSPTEISKAFSCCERALPLRHREIHFVHLPWTMAIVFQFAKGLLSSKLRQRFQTHATFERLKTDSAFPSELLPSGYHGGGDVTKKEMIDLWLAEMDARRDEVLALDEMKYGLTQSGSSASLSSGGGGDGGVLDVVGSMRKMENGKDSANR